MRTGNKREPAAYGGKIVEALLLSNALSLLLFGIRVFSTQTLRFSFLPWNLVLAWMPLVFAYWLSRRLRRKPWRSAGNILLTLLWLGFLPNSFYLVSDLIHLTNTGEISKLFDAALFFAFIFNGYTAGFMSSYLIHRELLKRRRAWQAHALIGLAFISCGFAIYLGRYLRWNTWDVLVNPAALLFDVSERVINPAAHPQAFLTTFTFSTLIASIYTVIFQFVATIKTDMANAILQWNNRRQPDE